MKLRSIAATLALAGPPLLCAAPAEAAVVTNVYQVVSRFTTGSIASVTQQYRLTFNPAVSGGGAVSSYSVSVADPSFNPPTGVQYGLSPSSSPLTTTSSISFGGGPSGNTFPVAGTFSFQNLFFVAPEDGAIRGGVPLIPFAALTRYSTMSSVFETTSVTVTLFSSAVPEAATWAMMVVGMGVVGGALRVRRRRIGTAPAAA